MLLTYTNLINLMKKNSKTKEEFKGNSALLKQIYKEKISDKKLNIKDTPENKIKLQRIVLRTFRLRMKKTTEVPVPDKAKGAVPQVKKNLTPYGKEADANEPDTYDKEAIKKDWTIVSDNCYGVAYMKALNKPYESPFFSMFIYAPDYIKLLENFDEYMRNTPVAQKPVSDADKFGGKSKYKRSFAKYPVLLLPGPAGDVELHFAHEKQSAEKAIQKWTSRTKRMSMDKKDMFVKMDDRDKFTVELGKRFLNLKQFPHKKLFVSQKYKSSLGGKKNVVVMDYKTQGPIGTKTEKLYPIEARP